MDGTKLIPTSCLEKSLTKAIALARQIIKIKLPIGLGIGDPRRANLSMIQPKNPLTNIKVIAISNPPSFKPSGLSKKIFSILALKKSMNLPIQTTG